MLPNYLNHRALQRIEERRQIIGRLASAEDVGKRKMYLRERMVRALGGFPERTPLNARTVGTLERDGYKIEKVIFESQPRFYVTANLYLPTTGKPPYPAILFPLGHERGAKANPTWQQFLATAARRGYVALAWDTIGQGERVQIYDPDFEDSKVQASTTEHSMVGLQCWLAGDALARYTIWDGIRALDYLLSRPEVDPARVACTGNSGGGTHTAYLAALDDRIQVAMPSCFITSWRRLLETIGPQDAEQCLPPGLEDRLDHGDFVLAFAPKPYLILSAIRDFFSISGARETYQEAQRIYGLLGSPDKLSMFEADDHHGYTAPRRQAGYRWLGRWLKGREDTEPEQLIQPEALETLWCTDSGRVAVSLGGETVPSLNRKRVEQEKPVRLPLNKPEAVTAHRQQVQQQVKSLTGFEPERNALPVTPFGRIEREGYHIEKLTYESEPGILVPALLYIPNHSAGRSPAVIYVNGAGKAASDEQAEQLVRRGQVVLAIDVRGTGETRPPQNDEQDNAVYRYFGHYDSAMTALLIGKTLVGMRAADIHRGVDLLAARPEVDLERIYGFGVGAGALVLLHEAVLDKRVVEVALEGMLESYESVVRHGLHREVFESVVPGVLKSYDLPDLVAALAPRRIWIMDSKDPMGNRVGVGQVRKEYSRAQEAYKAMGAEAEIHFALSRPDEKLGPVFEVAK